MGNRGVGPPAGHTHTAGMHAGHTYTHSHTPVSPRASRLLLASRLELKKAHGKARTTTSAPHRPHTPHRHAHSPQAASSGCLVTVFMT